MYDNNMTPDEMYYLSPNLRQDSLFNIYSKVEIISWPKTIPEIQSPECYIRGSTRPVSPPPGSQMENENDYNLAKYKNFLRKFYDTINITPILYIQL